MRALFTCGTQMSILYFGFADHIRLGVFFCFLVFFKAHCVFLVTFSLNTLELQSAASVLESIMLVLQIYAKHPWFYCH